MNTIESIRERVAEILAPAVNTRAPYAAVMIAQIANLVAAEARKTGGVNWDDVPWTPFVEGELPESSMPVIAKERQDLIGVAINSRYQVNLYDAGSGQPFGRVVWLSIKAHDRSARHDWRDLQRIKNEVVGPEYDAIEIFPAESKLVDTSNQYHLWVFLEFKMPFGFHERAVGDGNWNGSVQRPFPEGWRPADCLSTDDYAKRIVRANVRVALTEQAAKKGGGR